MNEQVFVAPDRSKVVISGLSDTLARPTFACGVSTRTHSEIAVEVRPGQSLALFENLELPDHIKVLDVKEFDSAGHRTAVADLEFQTPFGPSRSVRWVGWEGESGVVRCAWDAISADEALARFQGLGVEDAEGSPILTTAQFLHVAKGLRCIFDPAESGWLVVYKLWEDQKDRPNPLANGVEVPGGQMYRSQSEGETPSVHLLGPTTNSAFVQNEGVLPDAVNRIAATTISWE